MLAKKRSVKTINIFCAKNFFISPFFFLFEGVCRIGEVYFLPTNFVILI